MSSILDRLKEELNSWKESLTLRTAKVRAFNIALKQQEDFFSQRIKEIRKLERIEINEHKKENKIIKRQIYLAQKERKEAKDKIQLISNKISQLPSRIRRWNKQNFGKVIDSFEKGELNENSKH